MEAVYLDNNATTPLQVKDEIIEALELWGNPSSENFPNSRKAKEAVENARSKVASLFDVRAVDVVFTSGGTETNNWIITSAIQGFSCAGRKRVITSAIEHPSVQIPLEVRESEGEIELIKLPIDRRTGSVDINDLPGFLNENTCLVSVMLANNETGVYQPLEKISKIVRSSAYGGNILIHSDIAQVVGKRAVNLKKLGIDVATVVGHKFYGPRIGALVSCTGKFFTLKPLLFGGGQENGYRSGTENTPMAVGLGAAAQKAARSENAEVLLLNRNTFEAGLKRAFGDTVRINFEHSDRLENTTSACFMKSLITACEVVEKAKTFIASTGAACHAASITPSAVLINSGLTEYEALRTIRFSFGTDRVEIGPVVDELLALTTGMGD